MEVFSKSNEKRKEKRGNWKILEPSHRAVQQNGGVRLRVRTGERTRRAGDRTAQRGRNSGGAGRSEERGKTGMRKKATRERVVQRLYEMALGRANDAVWLAYFQEPTEENIKKLDLGAVAEFRRSNLGSVEIRFIDRVKALQALAELLSGEGGEAEEFLRAMVQAEEGA